MTKKLICLFLAFAAFAFGWVQDEVDSAISCALNLTSTVTDTTNSIPSGSAIIAAIDERTHTHANTTELSTITYSQLSITGTTPAVGGSSTYTTGLTHDQIVACSVMVDSSDGTWILPSHGTEGTGLEYYLAYISSSGYLTIKVLSASTSVDACDFVCVIWYSEL